MCDIDFEVTRSPDGEKSPEWSSRLCADGRSVLTPYAFGYGHGAAGDERARDDNVRALDGIRFVPRVLRDVGRIDTATELLGRPLSAPVLVAPMGLQRLVHPDGEAASAAGARSADVGFCLSMFSSVPVDRVAAGAPRTRLQQVYLTQDPAITDAVVGAAVDQGFTALLVTVDVPVVATRPRTADHGRDRFDEVVPALLDLPGVRARLAERAGSSAPAGRLLESVFPAPGSTWDTLAGFVARSPLPVLVKGILHPEDAVAAVRCGAAGVVVSNHGGRQLDRVLPSVTALPGVVAAVGADATVLFDSGVRRGSHVAAALALGATAVLVGRPVLWALATGGDAGVRDALHRVVAELRETMAQVGASDPAALLGTALSGAALSGPALSGAAPSGTASAACAGSPC